MTLIPCSSTGAETLHGMPRKQPLGRKHKAGTGNNMEASASRIISKTKVVTFSTQVATSSQVRVARCATLVRVHFQTCGRVLFRWTAAQPKLKSFRT